MDETSEVGARFCGPPDSANGGYVCGLLAEHMASHGDAEVTLRRAVPLDRPLHVGRAPDGGAVLYDGDDVVAEAVPSMIDIVVPPAVSVDDARRAAADSHVLREPGAHPFPTCFVCGPDRLPGDGMRLFAGPVANRDVVAAVWEPSPTLARDDGDDRDGVVRREFVWAALDCPGSFSMDLEPRLDGPYVLGRLGAHVDAPVYVGAPYVVLGWRAGIDGRKLFAGSALYDAHGVPVAYARATWVRLKPAA